MRKLPTLAFLGAALLCSGMAFGQKSQSPPATPQLPPGVTEGPASLSPGSGQVKVELPKGLLFLDAKASADFYTSSKQPVPLHTLGIIVDPESEVHWYADISYQAFGHVNDDGANEILKDSANLLTQMQEATRAEYAKMPAGSQTPPQIVGWYKPPTYDPGTHTLTTEALLQEAGEKDQTVNFTTFILGRYGGAAYTIVGTRHDAALIEKKQKLLATCMRFAPGQDYASWQPSDGTSDMTLTGLITGGAVVATAAKTGLLAKLGSYLVALLLAMKKAFIAILAGGAAFIRWIRSKLTGKPTAPTTPDPPTPPAA